MNKKIVATSMLNMFILITSMAERSLIPLPWMIIWLNGAFGAGKTSCAYELKRRIPNSYVYDPENIGYFIFNNIPNEMKKADFQDYEQWRTFNYSILKELYRNYSETIIVPIQPTWQYAYSYHAYAYIALLGQLLRTTAPEVLFLSL